MVPSDYIRSFRRQFVAVSGNYAYNDGDYSRQRRRGYIIYTLIE